MASSILLVTFMSEYVSIYIYDNPIQHLVGNNSQLVDEWIVQYSMYTYITIYYSLTILITVRVYTTVIFWQTPRAIYHFFGRIFAKVTTIVRIAPMIHNLFAKITDNCSHRTKDSQSRRHRLEMANSAVNAGGNKLTTAHVIEPVNIPLIDIE